MKRVLRKGAHVLLCLGFLSLGGSCQKKTTSEEGASLSGFFTSSPKILSPGELRVVFKKLSARLNCLPKPLTKDALVLPLIETVAGVSSGMLRWQIIQLLFGLIDPEQVLSGPGGKPLTGIFERSDIDDLLDSVHQKVRELGSSSQPNLYQRKSTLLTSFQREAPPPPKGAPQHQVPFTNEMILNSLALAGKPGGQITYGKLNEISTLVLRAHHASSSFDLRELVLFPRLKRITLAVWNPRDVVRLLPYAHQLEELEITRPMESSAPILSIKDLEPLATLFHLKTIYLTGVKIDSPDLLKKYFSYAKSLVITNQKRFPEGVNDQVLAALAQMPHLRRLELNLDSFSRTDSWRTELPPHIRWIKVSGSGDCKSLKPFKVFRQALSLTLSGCLLEKSIGPMDGPVQWQHLTLEQADYLKSPSQPLELSLSVDLDKLLFFKSNSRVQLDSRSRHELSLRLAQTRDNAGVEFQEKLLPTAE